MTHYIQALLAPFGDKQDYALCLWRYPYQAKGHAGKPKNGDGLVVCVRGLGIDSFQESSDATTHSNEMGPCFEYRHSILLVADSTRIQLHDA